MLRVQVTSPIESSEADLVPNMASKLSIWGQLYKSLVNFNYS